MKDDIPFLWHDVSYLRGIQRPLGEGVGVIVREICLKKTSKKILPLSESMPQD